jgi:hypothetical protein
MTHKIGKRANSRKEFIIMIFQIMLSCSLVIGYEHFGGTLCLHLQ